MIFLQKNVWKKLWMDKKTGVCYNGGGKRRQMSKKCIYARKYAGFAKEYLCNKGGISI
jgi:hypothetical protein